jgi:hypothetical protein
MSTTFNESYYLSQNPDVVLAISQGFFSSASQHFNLFGGRELRDPNSTFDTSYYSVQNPDVLTAVSTGVFANAFAHFQVFGVVENRVPTQAFASFDAEAYLEANADIAAAVSAGTITSALEHYMGFGAAEGRTGSGITADVTNPGSNFTLTTSNNQVTGGVDNFTGTDNNDTFVALADGALDQSDIIDGGAGTDTLKARYSLASSISRTASVTNVENIEIDVDDGDSSAAHTLTFSTSGFTGLSDVTVVDFESENAQKDTANVTNIATGVSVGIKNGDADGLYDFDYSSITGGTDTATLNLTSAKADNVTIAGIETLTVNAVSGSSTLDILTAAAATKLVVTGSGNVTATSLAASAATVLAEVDASAATGNVSIGDIIAGTVTLTGGSGGDTFSMGANLTTADTVTGGAGSDTIKVSTSETAALSKVTGVERIEIETDAGGNLGLSGTVSSEITTFIVDANDNDLTDTTANNITLSNMDTGDSIIVNDANSDTGDADGVNIIGTLTTDGAADAVTVTYQGIGATGAAVATGMDTLTLDSHETINMVSDANSTGTVTENGLEVLAASAATSLVFTGSSVMTIAAMTNTSTLTSVDASAMTGKLTMTGLDASAITFKAAAADTTLTMTGLNASDTIVGGAGTKDLVINTSTTGLTASTGVLNITDVETVELRATGANTIDASKLSGVTEISVSTSAAGAQTFTNLAAGVAIGIGDSADTVDNTNTFKASLADATGDSDSLTFNVDNSEAADTDVAITTADIETVNIAVDTASGNNSTVALANTAAANIVVTGGNASLDLTLNALNKATTSFDSSGLTGDVIVSAANATAGVTITTAGAQAAAHNITGSALGDTVTVGSTGNADFNAAGGAGTDTLNFTATTGYAAMANISAFENINLTVGAGVDITLTNATGINDADMNNFVVLGGNSLSTFAVNAATTLGAATTETIDASAFLGNINIEITEAAVDAGATMTVSGGALTTDHMSLLISNSATLALNTSSVDTIAIKEATGASTISFTNSDASLVAMDSANALTLTGLGASTDLQFGLTALGGAQLTAVDGVEAATITATYASVSGASDAVSVNLADTDAGATATLDIDGIETLTFNHVGINGTTTFENHVISLAGTANATNKIAVAITGGNASNTVTFAASGSVADVTSIDASGGLSGLSVNAAARANTGIMTITGSGAADTIAMENTGDVLTGGSGSDTLAISKTAILGGLNVDLTSTVDQISSFNGAATTGTVLGFENVDASGFSSGSFGAQLTGTTAANSLTTTANADVISSGTGNDIIISGAGNDVITVGATGNNSITSGAGDDTITLTTGTAATDVDTLFFDAVLATNGSDIINNFTATRDIMDHDGNLNGTTKAYEEIADNTSNITADSNVIVIGGTGTIGTAATLIAADTTVTETKGLIVISDGTNTLVYGTNNLATNGTEVLIATLNGISDPTDLVTANFIFA